MQIKIDLFGRVAARMGDTLFSTFPTKKTAELLMILAVHPDQPMNRKDLIALLWPSGQGGKANNRLSATLYMLRRCLENEFGVRAAGLIGSGEGSIWLQGEFESEYRHAESAWRAFSANGDNEARLAAAKRLQALYRGHLGADLRGVWFEPLQSLWASRWTESIIWRVQNGYAPLDEAIGVLTAVQPILPVTRSLMSLHLEHSGRSDLATVWQSEGPRLRKSSQSATSYRKYATDDLHVLARRPTMTALVVESHVVPFLRELVEQANPTAEWIGNPQIFFARNPLLARRLASRIRQVFPLARIYISTEVADTEVRDDARLLRWLTELEAGETLMNPAAASLIDQHDRSVVMERSAGRAEYRLL